MLDDTRIFGGERIIFLLMHIVEYRLILCDTPHIEAACQHDKKDDRTADHCHAPIEKRQGTYCADHIDKLFDEFRKVVLEKFDILPCKRTSACDLRKIFALPELLGNNFTGKIGEHLRIDSRIVNSAYGTDAGADNEEQHPWNKRRKKRSDLFWQKERYGFFFFFLADDLSL